MKTDTGQLRRAETEMISQITQMSRILCEAERIRITLKASTTQLDEILHSLKRWEDDLTEQKKKQLKLAMALDNISRIYEDCEKRIVEYGERPLQEVPFKKTQFALIQEPYLNTMLKFGGGSSEI